MVLQIPSRHRAGLAVLLGVDDDHRRLLLGTLRAVCAGSTPRTIEDAVVDALRLERESARSLVRMLLSLYAVRSEASLEPAQVATELLDAAEDEAAIEDLGRRRDDLLAFITEVMSLDENLSVTARALEVMHQHPRTFCTARLFTDVRPVFDTKDPSQIRGTVIVHNLRLTYHEGIDTRDFFVAMDRAEVEELRDVLQRALTKDSAARRIAPGLPVLDPEPDE